MTEIIKTGKDDLTWTIRTRQPGIAREGAQPEGLWWLKNGGRIETGWCHPDQALAMFFAESNVPPIDGEEYMVTPDKFAFAGIVRVRTTPTLEFVT